MSKNTAIAIPGKEKLLIVLSFFFSQREWTEDVLIPSTLWPSKQHFHLKFTVSSFSEAVFHQHFA